MSPAEVGAEIWTALRTDVSRYDGSCLVSNPAIPELRRHGVEMVKAVERVVRGPGFEEARRSEWLVGRNLLHLLVEYFEQAAASGWDSSGFLRSLEGPMLHEALVAVFQVWGPARGAGRRRVMPRGLYEAWHALLPRDPEWVGDRTALCEYLDGGSLSLV